MSMIPESLRSRIGESKFTSVADASSSRAIRTHHAEIWHCHSACGVSDFKSHPASVNVRHNRLNNNKRRILRPTFRRISTPRMCRSRPRGHPPGLTASTSRWPVRISRWKVHSASATKCHRAPAIPASARSRCKIRRSMVKTRRGLARSRAASH